MKIRNLHFNVLMGLNSFIIFFILFEDRIDLPVFLQVFGRLHPLLLHFPIVLLFLCWLLIFFRKKLEKAFPELKAIIGGLIFISAVLAAATVIMGLFLSKEGGYQGSSFQWHKWTGVALSFLSFILLYFSTHQKEERYHPLFMAGMNASLILLLCVGHFGAALTHGDDFVLAPLNKGESKALDLEQAMLFQDAILPILETKCMGCHNGNKPKGGLVLADTASILAGGKNGKLFEGGDPLKTLFVERLLLEASHKHRMPPKGKPQLTDGELDLLQAWVSSGARFNVPLSTLGDKDSLFQAVKLVYGIDENEHYDFPAADASTVEGLTTPYRIIKSLAAGSPALAVNFYGRDFYEPTSLSSLAPIANQVVSLNLSGMPVQAKDLEVLKSFKNLRELNLNDTPLNDEGLASLTGLAALKSLSLSGTTLSIAGAKQLLMIPSLRKLFVWNTAINAQEVGDLSQQFSSVSIDGGAKEEKVELPLTVPRVSPLRSFFRKEMPVTLNHPIAGVEIRYTLDGSDPDSTAFIYDKALLVDRNMTLRLKAFKDGWLPSEELKQTYFNAPITPDQITLDSRPHRLYRGNEGYSLFDMESGGSNNMDGKWIAFQQSELSANLYFDTPLRIDTVNLSVKQSYNEHIYPPQFIEVWGGKDADNIRLLTRVSPRLDKPDQVNGRRMLACAIHADDIGYIKLKAMPYRKIPVGYPASGNEAWIFLDEIVMK